MATATKAPHEWPNTTGLSTPSCLSALTNSPACDVAVQMRKRGREVQDSDGVFTERLSVHPSQYGSMDLEDFKTALAKLPDDQREAIILIGASGFSYEEAAAICECAVGTMKSRVSRARTRLTELLKISGESDYGPDAVSAQVTSGNGF